MRVWRCDVCGRVLGTPPCGGLCSDCLEEPSAGELPEDESHEAAPPCGGVPEPPLDYPDDLLLSFLSACVDRLATAAYLHRRLTGSTLTEAVGAVKRTRWRLQSHSLRIH